MSLFSIVYIINSSFYQSTRYMIVICYFISVKHDGQESFKFVTAEDFNIYPLKDDIDEDTDLSVLDINNYDLKKKMSNVEKANLLRPFKDPFGKINYIMITELKNTNTPDTFQELLSMVFHLYR